MTDSLEKKESYMKILFYSSYVSHESGASHAMREIVRRVASRGLDPIVVIPDCISSHEMFPPTEFNVYYVRIERPRKTHNPLVHVKYFLLFLPTLFAVLRIIRQCNPDVVHCNEITDFLAGVAARLAGKPCVCHVRADGISKLYRRALTPLLRRITDAVVVPSKSTAVWIRSEDRELADKAKLIYDYAFDMREYQRRESGQEFRQKCGVSADHILVLLVSKLVTPKGHECFIQAAERVLQTSKGIRFAIVGGCVPGHEAEASAIRKLAGELTPAPGLRMMDHEMNLAPVYAASDIAVHCPIFPDTYPTVVLLAMAAGKPIIGSRIGGIPEQIDEGTTGLLVPPNDPIALAQAIRLLANDPERRKSFGAAGRERVRREFAPSTQVQLLLEVYSDVVEPYAHGNTSGRIEGTGVCENIRT